MAISLVGGTQTSTVSTTGAPALPVAATVGNWVTVLVQVVAPAGNLTTVSGFGAIWTKLADSGNGNDRESLIFIGQVVTPSLTTATATCTGATSISASCQEWTGFTGIGPTLDQFSVNFTASIKTESPGSITTTQANALIIAMGIGDGSSTITVPTSPWIALHGDSSTNRAFRPVYQIVSSTGSFNPAWTWTTTNSDASSVIVSLYSGVANNPQLPKKVKYLKIPIHLKNPKKLLYINRLHLLRLVRPPTAILPTQIFKARNTARIIKYQKNISSRPIYKKFIYKLRLLKLIQPPLNLVNLASLNYLFYFTHATVAAGIRLVTVHRPKSLKRVFLPVLARVGVITRWHKLFSTVPTGISLRIVHRVKKIAAGFKFKILHTNPIYRLRLGRASLTFPRSILCKVNKSHPFKLILKSNKAIKRNYIQLPLGTWLRVLHRPKASRTNPVKPLHRIYRMTWLRLVQPPALSLGIWFKSLHHPNRLSASKKGIFLHRVWQKVLKFSFPTGVPLHIVHRSQRVLAKAIKIPLRIYRLQLLILVQPPAAKLGVLPRQIFRHSLMRVKFGPSLARISILVRWKKLFLGIPKGIPIHLIHRVRKTTAGFKFRLLYVYPLIKLKSLYFPTNVPIKLVHRIRKVSSNPIFKPLRRYSFKLLRLIQPPASALGVWLRIVHHTRRTGINLPRALLRINRFKLLRLIQPPAAGMWLRLIHRPYKVLASARLVFKRRNILAFLKVSFPTGIPLRLVQHPRKVLASLHPRFSRIYRLHLLGLVQPSASTLGVWFKSLHHSRRVFSRAVRPLLRVYRLHLFRLIQPPASELGVWLRIVHRTRYILPTFKPHFLRRFILLRVKLPSPSVLPIKLVHRIRIVTRSPRFRALYYTPMHLLRLVQPSIGMWLRIIHRPRSIRTYQIKPHPRIYRSVLLHLISPIVKGIIPKQLFHRLKQVHLNQPARKINIAIKRIYMNIPINILNLASLNYLFYFTARSSISLGIRLAAIHRPHIVKKKLRYVLTRLSAITRWRRLFSTKPTGISLRIVQHTRKVLRNTKLKLLHTKPLHLLSLVQPPVAKLGMWIKVIHRPRKLVHLFSKPRLRIFRLKLLKIGNPGGFWLKLVHHPKKVKPNIIHKNIVNRSIKRIYMSITTTASNLATLNYLFYFVTPTLAAIGLRLVTIHRPRKFRIPTIKPSLRIYRMKLLRLSIPKGLPIRLAHHMHRVTRNLILKPLQVNRLYLLKITRPPVAVWIQIIHRPRRILRPLKFKILHRLNLKVRLLYLVQPPAAKLGMWLKVIHRPRLLPKASKYIYLYRYSIKLLKLVQPPVAKLGVWLKTIHRPRILMLPPRPKFLIRRWKNLLYWIPGNLLVILPKRIFRYHIFKIKLGVAPVQKNLLIRWRRFFSLIIPYQHSIILFTQVNLFLAPIGKFISQTLTSNVNTISNNVNNISKVIIVSIVNILSSLVKRKSKIVRLYIPLNRILILYTPFIVKIFNRPSRSKTKGKLYMPLNNKINIYAPLRKV